MVKNKLNQYAVKNGYIDWNDLVSNLNPMEVTNHTVIFMESTLKEQKNVYLNYSESWTTIHLLEKLNEGCVILLNRNDYDGLGWEDLQGAVSRSKKLITNIKNYEKNSNHH